MSKPSLLDMLDQVRPDLEPLAPHFMADKELVEKERYLTLLAANLLEEGGLTEPQVRLFEMLLRSMKIERPLAFHLQQVAKLDKKELFETLSVLKGNSSKAHSFTFDLMMLLRISGTLSKDGFNRLQQQVALLLNNNDSIRRLSFLCLKLLNGGIGLEAEEFADDVRIARYNRSVGKRPSWLVSYDVFPKLPYSPGEFVYPKTIVIYTQEIDAYRQLFFPRCIVLSICAQDEDWRGYTWGAVYDHRGLPPIVAKVITIPDGLNSWLPLFVNKVNR
ncbi:MULTISPECIES: hypothetical protein [Aeromonas]|uniref:Uncharacterized protein n=1 Tax=Aeromonas salmonicida TaxID=645 RepID=A0AAX3VW20_AERSA|nr:hypothetical protein [Aeromonas salmonicida]WHF38182.1 hypothetical protein QLQ87_07520 [Aeromonas salmonicida]